MKLVPASVAPSPVQQIEAFNHKRKDIAQDARRMSETKRVVKILSLLTSSFFCFAVAESEQQETVVCAFRVASHGLTCVHKFH
jgi:hypothetical protein